MLYFALKTVEYFWKTEKQSKNVQNIIDLANKVSSQSVEIYDSAQTAHASVEKTMEKLDAVMNKIKGRGSLLSKILKMVRIGGLSPKKEIPHNIREESADDDQDDDDENTDHSNDEDNSEDDMVETQSKDRMGPLLYLYLNSRRFEFKDEILSLIDELYRN